jgi:hypothetical protein
MSKKDLKIYLSSLKKKQLEEQIIALYDKFVPVKVYYNFVFKPNEVNLIKDAKIKVSNEYFPIRGKKPKMRRSVSQKFIKHFITLGVDSHYIADLMLYSIEIAQLLTEERNINSEAFYKSMLNSYNQLVKFVIEKGILPLYKNRVVAIKDKTFELKWKNCEEFNEVFETSIFRLED